MEKLKKYYPLGVIVLSLLVFGLATLVKPPTINNFDIVSAIDYVIFTMLKYVSLVPIFFMVILQIDILGE